MGVLEERTYKPDCRFCDTEPEMYYNKDKKFGRFIENGSAYRIDTRQTPRQWLQYLCNDKIRSVVANDGAGFIFHRGAGAVTKYWSKTYLVRGVNGRRTLRIGEADSKDFFAEADSFSETVRPGYVTFEGKVDAFDVTVVIFVPAEVGCECWRVSVKNTAASERRTLVRGAVDWMLGTKEEFPQASAEEGAVIVAGQKVSGIFTAANAKTAEFKHFKEYREGKGDILLTDSSVTVEVALAAGEETTDADVTKVLQKTINELTEEREAFVKAGRAETVASLDNQLAVVREYLPKMLSNDEIKKIIEGLDDKSTPAVMRHFKAEYAGKVDMRAVGEILRSLQ
mgnify:CR=1 FL=1